MAETEDIEREERAIYIVIAAAGLPVVIGALLHGGTLDSGATISLFLVAIALVGLLGLWWRIHRRPRLPRAHVHMDARDHDSDRVTPSRKR